MSIQSSINQGLSLAALLATQTPEYKAAAEKRSKLKNLDAREKAVEKQTQAIAFNEELGPEESIPFHGAKMADIYEERFNVDPTAETLEKIRGFVDERDHGVEKNHEEQLAEQEAYAAPDQALAKEQAVRRESRKRRNFKDYMMNEPISLGGASFATFKDVSPDIQKQILSSYSRGEKTKMMNERDKLNG
jgi:hypothetical protein